MTGTGQCGSFPRLACTAELFVGLTETIISIYKVSGSELAKIDDEIHYLLLPVENLLCSSGSHVQRSVMKGSRRGVGDSKVRENPYRRE